MHPCCVKTLQMTCSWCSHLAITKMCFGSCFLSKYWEIAVVAEVMCFIGNFLCASQIMFWSGTIRGVDMYLLPEEKGSKATGAKCSLCRQCLCLDLLIRWRLILVIGLSYLTPLSDGILNARRVGGQYSLEEWCLFFCCFMWFF